MELQWRDEFEDSLEPYAEFEPNFVYNLDYKYRQSLQSAPPSSPLLFDLGSYALRAAFAPISSPGVPSFPAARALHYRSLIGKSQLPSHEGIERASSLRSPFEGGILARPELLERLLDHAFAQLSPPIGAYALATEPPAPPRAARARLLELMFEVYGLGGLLLAPDAAFHKLHARGPGSRHANASAPSASVASSASVTSATPSASVTSTAGTGNGIDDGDCITVRIGHEASFVYGGGGGGGVDGGVWRLPLGMRGVGERLQRRLQLAHPAQRAYVTPLFAERCKRRHVFVAREFKETAEKYQIGWPERTIWVQFPFQRGETAEEAQRREARKRAQGARMREWREAKRRREGGPGGQDGEGRDGRDGRDGQDGQDGLDGSDGGSGHHADGGMSDAARARERHRREWPGAGALHAPRDAPAASPACAGALYRADPREWLARARRRIDELSSPSSSSSSLPSSSSSCASSSSSSLSSSSFSSSSASSASAAARLRLLAQASQSPSDAFGASDADWDVYLRLSAARGAPARTDAEHRELRFLWQGVEALSRRLDGAVDARIPLAVERAVAAEALFAPNMAGGPWVGLGVMAARQAVKLYEEKRKKTGETGKKRKKTVLWVCGGGANLPGVGERVEREVRERMPEEADVEVVVDTDDVWGAMRGMAEWANERGVKDGISRERYLEEGAENVRQAPFKLNFQ